MAIANITNNILTDSGVATSSLQIALNGTGFVKISGTTISYDNSTYALDSAVVKLTGTQTVGGAKTFSTYSKFDGGVILKNNVSASLAGYVGLSAYSASGNKGINIDFDTYSASFYFSGTLPYQYTYPAATGTLALTSDLTGGTVTSVAALTIGTSGTDLSSTVANSTTTPVITLNVPTASATNRGALSSADWTTFNNKQSALTNPVLASGTWTSGYLPKINGTYTIGNSLLYDNGTNVGIGTISPNHLLSLSATASNATVIGLYNTFNDATNRNWAIATNQTAFGDFDIRQSTAQNGNPITSGTSRLYIASTGAATFSSSVTATSFFESSDSRLKTLIQDNYQTKGIASITPKLYTKNGKVELGYYAQDFVGVLDSAVSTGSDDMLSLSYREVHTAKIYALEQEIKELKAKMN